MKNKNKNNISLESIEQMFDPKINSQEKSLMTLKEKVLSKKITDLESSLKIEEKEKNRLKKQIKVSNEKNIIKRFLISIGIIRNKKKKRPGSMSQGKGDFVQYLRELQRGDYKDHMKKLVEHIKPGYNSPETVTLESLGNKIDELQKEINHLKTPHLIRVIKSLFKWKRKTKNSLAIPGQKRK